MKRNELRQRPSNELYYLHNFRFALQWLRERYADLLLAPEHAFIEQFEALPSASQALLVRLIMRKGLYFRAAKISYSEIDSTERAVEPLVDLAWVDPRPLLTVDELFKLVTRVEVVTIFPGLTRGISKSQALEVLRPIYTEARVFEEWRGYVAERVFFVAIAKLCTRLKLLYFGNFRQEWSEFVLAELGIFKYEKVAFSKASRPFDCRHEIEDFFTLYECSRQLYERALLADVLAQVPLTPINNEWLENRRSKLIFEIAQQFERNGESDAALPLYLQCPHPGARWRAIRTLEKRGEHECARALAHAAAASPGNAAEAQKVSRVLYRLDRRVKPRVQSGYDARRPERLDLTISNPAPQRPVEQLARERLADSASRVYYVENALVNSLFGLLCWEAIFAPIKGAFFHPFHIEPADLLSTSFHARRTSVFQRCFARLDSGEYQQSIRQTFFAKRNTLSPFVAWGQLSVKLLNISLTCIPAAHLRSMFERLLCNLSDNRSGLPDLIQFWPDAKQYRMVEVKGPGDRLQDNQQRWLEFCLESSIPVAVCHVRWAPK